MLFKWLFGSDASNSLLTSECFQSLIHISASILYAVRKFVCKEGVYLSGCCFVGKIVYPSVWSSVLFQLVLLLCPSVKLSACLFVGLLFCPKNSLFDCLFIRAKNSSSECIFIRVILLSAGALSDC